MHPTISKVILFAAFMAGSPLPALGLRIINSIQREDGSNKSYNVTGIDKYGQQTTMHVYTLSV